MAWRRALSKVRSAPLGKRIYIFHKVLLSNCGSKERFWRKSATESAVHSAEVTSFSPCFLSNMTCDFFLETTTNFCFTRSIPTLREASASGPQAPSPPVPR